MQTLEIPVTQRAENKILSGLDANLDKIIEILLQETDIYSLLSLYELHKQNKFNGFPDHFETLLRNRKDKDISLLKGDAMFIYLCCLLYEHTTNPVYINTAFELVNKARLDDMYNEPSLFNGYAGFLLSLLRLVSCKNHTDLLKKANVLINMLLNNIEYDDSGISWREVNDNPYISIKPQNIKNTCGFGNGASGITYMFCLLSEIFNNKAFLKIVSQALLRQEELFDKNRSNWPDFNYKVTSHTDHKKHIENYKKKQRDWFSPSYGNYSLEDGLTGIALSNILMFQYTGNVKQKEIYYNALNRICTLNEKQKSTPEQVAETGLLLLNGYKVLKDETLLSVLEKILENTELHLNDALQNHISIYFYFILSYLYPTENFIPATDVRLTALYEDISLAFVSEEEIKKILLKKVFARTVAFIELSRIDLSKTNGCDGHLIKSFIQDVQFNEKCNSEQKLKEVFDLELRKYELQNKVKSRTYCFARGLAQYEEFNSLAKLKPEEFFNVELVINPECEIYGFNYDWTKTIDWNTGIAKKGILLHILENEPDENCFLLFYYRHNGYVSEKSIEEFDLILIQFQEPTRIEKASKEVINKLKPQNEEQLKLINEKIRSAILFNFQEGILLKN